MDDGSMIRVTISQSIQAGAMMRIKVGVQNPLAKLIADFSVQGIRKNSYRTMESGLFVSALSTTLVQIFKGSIKYLWGISQNENTDMPIGVFKSGTNLVAANSVRISFLVDLEMPVGKEYVVQVCLGEAKGLIINSVVTNLPRYDYQNEPNCYQNLSGTKMYLECNSVGALAKKNYEYFVAVKVYYVQNTIVNFGGVNIFLKSYPAVSLYKAYAGETVTAFDNTEYLDTSGYHSSSFGFGTTQIVTAIDSKKPAALPNGVETVLSSNIKNTVGIIPIDVSDYQLLFFLKVLPTHYTGTSTIGVVGNTVQYVVRMSILFNSNVVMYETSDVASAGLDFAAYQAATGSDIEKWTVDQIPCYVNNICSWEGSLSTMDNSLQRSSSASSAKYSVHRFECLTTNQVDCDNWRGFSKTNGYSGVFGMRKIKFPTGFHSQVQAGDDQVLDFVVAFHIGKYVAGSTSSPSYQLVSAQIINAYTIQASKLSSAKISYVNFSDKSVNPGHKFPTFLRVGGTVNPSEHLGATTVAVFFDQSVDFSAFYSNVLGTQGDKLIGCSSQTCKVYDSSSAGQDTWMNTISVIATGVRDKENDFELLIPFRNILNSGNIIFPYRLVVAFCDYNKTSSGVQHQLRVLSVYRVFGATVDGDISVPISTANNLGGSLMTSALTLSSSSWFTNVSSGSSYTLDVTNVAPMGATDTSLMTTAQTIANHNSLFSLNYYGAGFTLSSLYFDLFSTSWIGLASPPFGVSQNCTKFNYYFYDTTTGFEDYTGKFMYNVFCPIDASLSTVTTSYSTLNWINPFFGFLFSSGMQISSILNYSFSSSAGKIYSYLAESKQVLSSASNTCTQYVMDTQLRPLSTGRQSITMGLSMNGKIPLDITGATGYAFIRVELTFSTSLTGLTYFSNSCTMAASSLMTCSVSSFLPTSWAIIFKPTSVKIVDIQEIIQFTIDLESTSLAVPSAAISYSLNVYLPTQKTSGNIRIFGDNSSASISTFMLLSTCSGGIFNIGVSAYSTQMNIVDLTFDFNNVGSRSAWQLGFTFTSPRERFYSTSAVKFNFGFLAAGNDPLVSLNNLRCLIFEAASGTSTYSLSWKWQYITYEVNLQNVRVYPRYQFSNPHQYSFQLRCEGGIVPDTSLSGSQLMGYWIDTSQILQQTSTLGSMSYPSSASVLNQTSIVAPSSFSLYSKLWTSGGFEASYTFEIQSTIHSIDYFSRFYFHFESSVGVDINRERYPECYLRTNLSTAPSVALTDLTLAYCEVIGENRISVWSNKIIAKNTLFHVIIYGVAQPSQSLFSSMISIIWIAIDDDSIVSNGISSYGWATDASPVTPSTGFDYSPFLLEKILGDITVQTPNLTKIRIRSSFDFSVTFSISPSQLVTTKYLYILLNDNFSDSVRGDSFTCYLYMAGVTTSNYAKACEMESNRLVRIQILSNPSSSTTVTSFEIILKSFLSPEYVPKKIKNEVSVLLYLGYSSPPMIVDYVQHLAINSQSAYMEFDSDPDRVDLIWNIYTQKRTPSTSNPNMKVVTTTFDRERTVFVNIGYYNRLIRLVPYNNSTYLLHLQVTSQSSSTATTTLFSFSPTTFQADRNALYIQFQMAALSTSPAGVYLLKMDKVGDGNSLYSAVPTLKVVVSGEPCAVNAVLPEYDVPIGGVSLPIEFDFISCIPTQDVTFTPLYPITSTSYFQSNLNYEVDTMTPTTRGQRMVWIMKESTNDSSKIGTSLPVTYLVSGTNQKSFSVPNGIQLNWVAPLTASAVATDVTQVNLGPNAASFNISCSQTGIAFWVIGINPSVTSVTLDQIKAKVTSTATGLLQYTDVVSGDKYKMVYGSDIIYSASKNILKEFTSLKANAKYSMKYFCWNQMQQSSGESTVSWKVPDNGSALLKITFSFATLISFAQQIALTCAVQSYFSLPKARVISDISTRCDELPNYINLNKNNKNVKNKYNSLYPYSVYVEPDTSVSADYTNEIIQALVRAAGFTTSFLATVSGYTTLPTLGDVETKIILLPNSGESPTVSETASRIIGETIVSMSLTISGGDGYIIVGLEEGLSNTIPTVDQIRKGLNYYNNNLNTFELRFAWEQVQQEFKFIQLKPGTNYTAYLIGSNDDPSANSLISTTTVATFTTQGTAYSVYISSNKIRFDVLVSMLLTLLLI